MNPLDRGGCSDLFRDIWGTDRGARSAVGMGSLPGNIAVEIKAIFEVDETEGVLGGVERGLRTCATEG